MRVEINERMDRHLDMYKLLKLTQENTNIFKNTTTSNKMDSVIKNWPI